MHAESPISGNISLRRLKGLARSLALLVVFWLSACGPTRLLHLDGEPFVPRLPLVHLDGGWLAVDSCAKGIHALLELEVEAGEQAPVSGMPAAARLRYDAAGLRLAHRPRYARVDGPLCWNEGPRRFQEQGVWTGAFPRHAAGWETRHCVYLLRAQFVLDRLPAPGDLVHLDYSGEPVAVRSQ